MLEDGSVEDICLLRRGRVEGRRRCKLDVEKKPAGLVIQVVLLGGVVLVNLARALKSVVERAQFLHVAPNVFDTTLMCHCVMSAHKESRTWELQVQPLSVDQCESSQVSQQESALSKVTRLIVTSSPLQDLNHANHFLV